MVQRSARYACSRCHNTSSVSDMLPTRWPVHRLHTSFVTYHLQFKLQYHLKQLKFQSIQVPVNCTQSHSNTYTHLKRPTNAPSSTQFPNGTNHSCCSSQSQWIPSGNRSCLPFSTVVRQLNQVYMYVHIFIHNNSLHIKLNHMYIYIDLFLFVQCKYVHPGNSI